jgi:hypothetical protein
MFNKPKVVFLESAQYSLESVKIVIKNFRDDRNTLPISMSKDNIKCLDFDLDKVVFSSVPTSQAKIAEIYPCKAEVNPYNKTWLEVMDMV